MAACSADRRRSARSGEEPRPSTLARASRRDEVVLGALPHDADRTAWRLDGLLTVEGIDTVLTDDHRAAVGWICPDSTPSSVLLPTARPDQADDLAPADVEVEPASTVCSGSASKTVDA